MKAGFVALIGRPNAGKSTLLNRFVGQKVAIVSSKPQTTRHRIVGVRHAPGAQMVFVDTPGIHKPAHRLNRRMMDAALAALVDVDLVVLLVDAAARAGSGDAFILGLLERQRPTVVLALNKIDLIEPTRLLPIIDSYAKAFPFAAIVPISAWTGDGVDRLEREILAALPEGEPLFPEGYFTDQTERTLAAELIREKVLANTRQELPYTTAVVIDGWEAPREEGGLTRIHACILVDRESQRPIVIGARGEMIKRIGTEARRDLEEMTGGKVHLDLHVKIRADWRDDERFLDELGLQPRR